MDGVNINNPLDQMCIIIRFQMGEKFKLGLLPTCWHNLMKTSYIFIVVVISATNSYRAGQGGIVNLIGIINWVLKLVLAKSFSAAQMKLFELNL